MTETTQQTWMDATAEAVVIAACELHPNWSLVHLPPPHSNAVIADNRDGHNDVRDPRTDPRDAINFCRAMGCRWEKRDGSVIVGKDLRLGLFGIILKDDTPESLADALTRGTLQVLKAKGFDTVEAEGD